jgi:hypothetical protein
MVEMILVDTVDAVMARLAQQWTAMYLLSACWASTVFTTAREHSNSDHTRQIVLIAFSQSTVVSTRLRQH